VHNCRKAMHSKVSRHLKYVYQKENLFYGFLAFANFGASMTK